MSPLGRPQGEWRAAARGAKVNPTSPPGRLEGGYRPAARSAKGRPPLPGAAVAGRRDAGPALATPFAWPASGLDPLPWFPFTVGVSRGHAKAGERVAQRTERAYWHLRKLLGVVPRFRLLVLAPGDWAQYADVEAFGACHATGDGHLVVGTEPADAWHEVSRFLALHLPGPALRTLVKAHGADAQHPTAPDLGGVADALVIHEVAHLVAAQSGAAFPRRWLAEAFANYALIAALAETEPAMLHRIGSLAEATRVLAEATPGVAEFEAADGTLEPAHAVLTQLALTRAAFAAYADAGVVPLQRWFAAAQEGRTEPDADHELGRMLARIHPALAALAPDALDTRRAVAPAA